jgi:hypothetical protein
VAQEQCPGDGHRRTPSPPGPGSSPADDSAAPDGHTKPYYTTPTAGPRYAAPGTGRQTLLAPHPRTDDRYQPVSLLHVGAASVPGLIPHIEHSASRARGRQPWLPVTTPAGPFLTITARPTRMRVGDTAGRPTDRDAPDTQRPKEPRATRPAPCAPRCLLYTGYASQGIHPRVPLRLVSPATRATPHASGSRG